MPDKQQDKTLPERMMVLLLVDTLQADTLQVYFAGHQGDHTTGP